MLHQTKVLLDRAVALQRGGHWQSAIGLCEEVLWQGVHVRDIESVTESLLQGAFSYQWSGDTSLAADQFELAITIAQLNGDHGRAGRAMNGLAVLHYEHGELNKAEHLYFQAHEEAVKAGDVMRAGDINQNLGILANVRGDLHEALERYQSSLASYKQINHQHRIARVLNNLGMLYIDMSQLGLAEQSLDQALDIASSIGDPATESIIRINRTELLIEQGHLDHARICCDEAFEIVSKLEEHSSRAELLKFYGIIYRETNKHYLAETHLREAIEIAAAHNYPLQEAEALRELSHVFRAQSRNQEALEALNRSHALFTGLQAKKDQADVSKRVAQLQEDFLSLVRFWGESIEAKDLYTSGHCQRVADYACRMAERAGIAESEMVWFRMGAFLHDVGKTEVPEEILNKPGKLTPEERQIMERHTVFGDEMLSSIAFPWNIRPMIRSHHERWDGNGYPDGLSGEAIPLTARILRFADVFDALTTTRSYRAPLTAEQALKIMEEDSGGFDPALFEIFHELFAEFAATVGEQTPAAAELSQDPGMQPVSTR